MESRAKLAGHPIHPMLIVFPLGLLVTAVVFDVVYKVTGNSGFAVVAYWNILAGLVGGALAAVTGLIDWLAIPRRTRARAIGLWHGLGNAVLLALFAVSWSMRTADTTYIPSNQALILEIIAVMIGVVTGWLGGELVDRLGVGVDAGAHLNSPNSLSGRPAREGSHDGAASNIRETVAR
jgi:uncharacterized membrane protein